MMLQLQSRNKSEIKTSTYVWTFDIVKWMEHTSSSATGKENRYPETIDRKILPGIANVCKNR